MARPLRVEFAGALYHVTSRGNERGAIFLDRHDYERRLDWLARAVEMQRWLLHAFALMPNHDHLFLETPEANLSAGMQFLNGSYAGYFNARHERVGHLFQGRYQAVLIENEKHYGEVSRYIHLNAVRAGLAARPEEYPWSSFSGYYRRQHALSWVTYARVLNDFAKDPVSARREYRRFVDAGVSARLRSPLREAWHGMVLGSEGFLARVRRHLDPAQNAAALPELRALQQRPPLARIIAAAARRFGADSEDWARGRRCAGIERAVAAHVARKAYGYPATAVAGPLGYSGPSSVSMAVRRVAAVPSLEQHVAAIRKRAAID